MKPVAFDYERPGTLDAAAKLLTEDGVFSKIMAGSQSLGPMLNLRLAQPELLIDITSIAELMAVKDDGDTIEIGACVTHADIEDRRVPDVSNGLLPHVAGGIAYRAVRNRGTIGGSLAHADPAADWISVLPLLGADIVARSQKGDRIIAAADLMISSFTTQLQQDELIRAIRIPKLSQSARWGFCKINQKVGEFAHALAGVLHDPDRHVFRAVIGAIETTPIVVADAAGLFRGPPGPDLAERLDAAQVSALLDGKQVADPYNRKLALVALKRAARQAGAPA